MHPATADRYALAESPMWDPVRRRLLWVDIEDRKVWVGRLDGDRIEVTGSIGFPDRVGAVAPALDGSLVVAVGGDIVRWPAARSVTGIASLVPPGSGRRLNDGKPDPRGRYVVGSIAIGRPSETEQLFLAANPARILDSDLRVSNGLAWSLDGTALYSVDSGRRTVFRRDWDPATGEPGRRHEFVVLPDGVPDGIALDAEGHLWVALWGAGRVDRIDPEGRTVHSLDLPAKYPTSVAFAGDDLDRMVVTTASWRLDAAELAAHPHSGKLFLADAAVPGAPQAYWNGELPAGIPAF